MRKGCPLRKGVHQQEMSISEVLTTGIVNYLLILLRDILVQASCTWSRVSNTFFTFLPSSSSTTAVPVSVAWHRN